MGFEPLNQVADVLAPLGVPWWVAGGLAVDAQVGKPTRAHADADVLVLQRDVAAVARALPQAYAERPERAEPIDWDRSSPLVPGVEALALPVRFQGGISKLQILVGRSEAGQWVYHRRRGTLRLPLEDITRRTSDGVPLPRADRHLAVQVATAPRERHRRLSDASSVARGERATVAARRHPPLAAGSSVAGGALSVGGGERHRRPDMLQSIYAVDLPPQAVRAHDLPPEICQLVAELVALVRPQGTVLDVGIGSGAVGAGLSSAGTQVAGVDTNAPKQHSDGQSPSVKGRRSEGVLRVHLHLGDWIVCRSSAEAPCDSAAVPPAEAIGSEVDRPERYVEDEADATAIDLSFGAAPVPTVPARLRHPVVADALDDVPRHQEQRSEDQNGPLHLSDRTAGPE